MEVLHLPLQKHERFLAARAHPAKPCVSLQAEDLAINVQKGASGLSPPLGFRVSRSKNPGIWRERQGGTQLALC